MLDLTPEPREVPRDDWRPAPRARRGGAGGRGRHRPRQAPDPGRGHRPRGGRSTRGARPSGSPAIAGGVLAPVRTLARPAPDTPLNVADRRAAPLRRWPRPTSTTTGGCARRTAAPSTTSCWRPWPARCAPGCSPAASRSRPTTTVRAMVPVSVRAEGAGRLGNRVSSYFVDLPVGEGNAGHAAAPGDLRDARPQGVGAVGRRRRARAAVRLRAADHPLARRAGRVQRHPAAVQPRRHQRARAAVPALRRRRPDAADVPGRAARQGPGASAIG